MSSRSSLSSSASKPVGRLAPVGAEEVDRDDLSEREPCSRASCGLGLRPLLDAAVSARALAASARGFLGDALVVRIAGRVEQRL